MKYDFCTTLSCMCFSFPGYFSGYSKPHCCSPFSAIGLKLPAQKPVLWGAQSGRGELAHDTSPAQHKLLLIIELSNISLHHVFIKNASIFTLDSVFNYVKKKNRGGGGSPFHSSM